MQKICRGDTVVVTTGKSRGHKGEVLNVIHDDNRTLVVVGGANLMTKHVKATSSQPGGRIKKEAPMDISNVKLVDPKSGKSTRVGTTTAKNGKRQRVAKVSSAPIPSSFKKS